MKQLKRAYKAVQRFTEVHDDEVEKELIRDDFHALRDRLRQFARFRYGIDPNGVSRE